MDNSIIKDEYLKLLKNILIPSIYEGIKELYNNSVKKYNILITQTTKRKIKIGKITEESLFQNYLNNVSKLNDIQLEQEIQRIKEYTDCQWLDDLIKSVIKSHIILLTCNAEESKLLIREYYNNINTKIFIHKCYIECCKIFFNLINLFIFNSSNKHQNILKIYELIDIGITNALFKILPTKQILKEYLKSQYYKKQNLFNNIDNKINIVNNEEKIISNIKKSEELKLNINKNNNEIIENNNEIIENNNEIIENKELTDRTRLFNNILL